MACRTPNDEALEDIRAGIDHLVEVTDDQIEAAMRVIYDDTHNLAEGAGAASVAGLLSERHAIAGRRVAVVLTGGNVDRDVFARVLSGG
jgi:threonine dehydratase